MNNEWLDNEFPKYKGRTVKGDVLNAYYQAEMILKGNKQINKRGCSCQFGSMAREVDRLYEQYQEKKR